MRLSEEEYCQLIGKPIPKTKRRKYRNTKLYEYQSSAVLDDRHLSHIHGEIVTVYDSRKEFERYRELQILEKASEISGLERQVKLTIQEPFVYDGKKILGIVYTADFVYKNKEGKVVIEDVKPFDEKTGKHRLTKDFSLKWKLLMAKHPEYKFNI